MVLLFGIAAFFSTLLGGFFAIRLRDSLHLILGFSAGAVLAVAFFDLIPEALELSGKSADTVLSVVVLGFLTYMVIDRMILIHGHNHEHTEDAHRGSFGAAALCMHSFLDGIGVGFAFQVSPAVGAIVAAAVLAHDFSDGINTVAMVSKSGGDRATTWRWLLIDAVAPIAGILVTMFFSISEANLGLLLALFGGFFLYIGASDLIPESHHGHPVRWTTISTVLGVGFLYCIIRVASI